MSDYTIGQIVLGPLQCSQGGVPYNKTHLDARDIEIDRLTAENERLRGALELIASPDQCSDEQYWMVKRAREALKGGE